MSHSAISSGFWLHVTCLKMLLLQFRFSCQSGPDPPPRRKLSRMKNKNRKRNRNVAQQKANLNAHRAVFRMRGWVSLAGLSLTRKARQWNAVFAQMPICGHAWIYCCTTFQFFRKTSIIMKSLKKLVSCSKERRAGNLKKLAAAADLLKVLRAWGKITKTGVSAPSRVRKNGEPWCLICFGY